MKRRHNWTVFLVQTGLVALFLVAWEISARVKVLDPFYVSSPARIAKHVTVWLGEGILFKHLWVTLSEAAVGLIAGMLLGLAFGFLFAASRKIDAVLQPFIGVLNALPRIAFAPLIYCGLGLVSSPRWSSSCPWYSLSSSSTPTRDSKTSTQCC